MNTALETQRTVRIPAHKKQRLFHEASKPTTYIVEQNALLDLFDVMTEDQQTTSVIRVILEGRHARAQVYGLFFGTNTSSHHIEHTVEHRAAHTESRIITRGVLGGSATAAYAGRIIIPKGVPGCTGQEEAHTLLLSHNAHIDAVPHLEIGNNDVKCQHSVSITYIDELKKFYLESRGVEEAEVVKTIILGHYLPILEQLEEAEKMKRETMITAKL